MSLESPGERPGLGKLGSPGKSSLGSLAQSARHKHINQARSYLLWIGGLTMVLSGFVVAMGQYNAGQLPPGQVQALTVAGIIGCVEGLVFIVLGLLTRRYPVPATILGLILYVADGAVYLMNMDARNVQIPFIKIIIILFLARAVQAAIASERERKEAEALGDFA